MRTGIRHRVELVAYVVTSTVLRGLPHRAARPLGRALGELGWRLLGGYRRIVRSNLALALPEVSAEDRERIARRSFHHLGATACEIVSTGRFDAVELCRHMTLEGWDRLVAVDRPDRGLLLVTAHLGNWEVTAHPVGLYRGPLHVVARPFNNPLVYRRFVEERTRFGHRVISKRGAARTLLRVLREGGKVGVVMDQRVRSEQGGIPVPFFGVEALTTPIPASLALRTGVPTIPIFAYPKPEGGWRIEIEEAIPPEGDPRDGAAVAAQTRRYLAVMESAIRRHPEQWLWMHRRWRID